MAEVESQPIRVHFAPLLLGVFSESRLESMMQDVGCRVGSADRVATILVDRGLDGFAFLEGA